MIGLAYGSAGRVGAGAVSNVIVEMENGWMFVTGIRDGSLMCVVTTKSADIGTIGYEIAVFADRAGDVLTPEVREELKCLMLSRA
jgi:predicted regulator of Ras-like GTPase activity (Roadblock/LC7/MglB family)